MMLPLLLDDGGAQRQGGMGCRFPKSPLEFSSNMALQQT